TLTALFTRRTRPTRRGWALLISGAILIVSAYSVDRTELLYLGSFLIVAPLLALATVRLRRVRVHTARRFTPHLAHAHQRLDISIDVRNRAAGRTTQSAWRDTLPWPAPTAHGTLEPLAAYRSSRSTGTTTSLSYHTTPPRRGVHSLGPLIIDTPDPFGLARGEVAVGDTHDVIVAPSTTALPDTGRNIAADDGSARAVQLRSSANDDELMTREYRAGDPLRRVHWKASARHGELMVRQEEQRSHARARLVLDTRRRGYRDLQRPTPTEPESDNFEWLVSFASSLTHRLQHTGFTVDVTETARPQLASPDIREEFLESLATLELREEPRRENQLGLRPEPGRTLGTIFVLLSDAEPHIVDELAANRVHYDHAVAFIIAARREAVAEPLAAAGYTCIEILPDDDPVDVWLTIAHLAEHTDSYV
ncbi:MAG TPA: DUF58 domain-containing protein, partial [Terrimesophilobacter sp.]|nr:DUF58 domain-containing protein [Terrimesophilobacter sp.]